MVRQAHYRVLGPVEATAQGTLVRLGGPKQRLVLALLLIDAGRPVSDGRLVDGVWGDDGPARPRHILQTYVSELRQLLDDEIRREGSGYRLLTDPEAVDVHRFEALVGSGRELLADSPSGAAEVLREALALWQGPPYADLTSADILQPEIHRLEQMRVTAVEDRVRADLACGRHAGAAAELEALTREHPYREGLRALHMLALYRCGRQADALLVYERSRELLTEQLGIDPSPELQTLQRQVLAQDPDLELEVGPGGTTHGAAAPAGPPRGEGATPTEVVRGFELRDRIGEGDHGTTYRAYQASLGREVAVKVVRTPQAATAAFVRTFETRTAAVARVEHPHLVPLLDSWRDPEAVYVVTAWFRQGDVRRTLHAGNWSLPATLRLLDQVGGALDAAHQLGVLHGGVKATNVLLDTDGNAYLTDFPVVARSADAGGVPQTTTPALLTPEERLGRPLSPRSDVHGVALLAIEVLQGSLPASDDPVDALARSRPNLPSPLLEVLRRATSTDPEARHPHVLDLLRDVRRAVGTDVVGPPGIPAPARPARNPYKGLQAFREEDAPDFFGREALTRRLVESVGAHRLVAVVGPSGSGKSSLVRAGLVPALRAGALPRSREWLVTELYPGSHPFEELEAALRRVATRDTEGALSELLSDDRGLLRVVKRILPDDDSELVLVIDQFEELFVLTTDPDVRRLFLDSLVALAGDARGRVRTVLTMRADFFDRPLQQHDFGRLLEAGLVPVTMPAPDELGRAVVQPARQVGVEFEGGLVTSIVRDVADQPGGLPMLQHALTELFARHEGSLLTAADYRAAGGVTGALGRRAEEMYGSLSPAAQEAAEQILLRLVTVDEHADDARRRVRRSDLAGLTSDPATTDEVVQTFGAHRLLTFDRDPITRTPTIEVAHESLFREWDRLRGWIESRREDLLLHRRLAAAVAEWVQSGRDDDYLLQGGRLGQFDEWAAGAPIALAGDERDLLAASRAHHTRAAQTRRRRRAALLAGAIVAALVGVGLAAVAFVSQQRAAAGERVATARALAAESGAQLAVDQDRAVQLALDAVEVARAAGEAPLPVAVQALHDAVRLHRVVQVADHDGVMVKFLGGGQHLLSVGPPGLRPVVWERRTGEAVRTLDPSGQQPTDWAVSPDGRLLAETSMGGDVRVSDLRSGETVAQLRTAGDGQWRPVFGPDGTTLALLDDRHGQWWLSIWDVPNESERVSVPAPQRPTSTAFDPDGTTVAVATETSSQVRLYDATTGEETGMVGPDDPARSVSSVVFDPAGRLVTYLSGPSEILVTTLGADRPELRLPVGPDPNTVCATGDGSAIVATAADEVVRVWDARSGDLLLRLPGSAGGGVLDCGPDGRMIATVTDDGAARIWDITPEGEAEVLTVPTPAAWSAAWTTDEQAVLSTHADGTLLRHDLSTGEVTGRAPGLTPHAPARVAVSSDGRHLAVAQAPVDDADGSGPPPDGSVLLLDLSTLDVLRDTGVRGWPVSFTPDGTHLLVVGLSGTSLYDVAADEVTWRLDQPVGEGTLLPGGDRAVLAPFDLPEVWLVDLSTGEPTTLLCMRDDRVRGLAVGGDEGSIAVAVSSTVEVFDLGSLRARPDPLGCSSDQPLAADAAHVASLEANAWLGLTFDPAGRWVGTAGFDGVVAVWDAATGTNHLRLEHDAQVSSAAFSPGGDRMVVAVNPHHSGPATVRVYTLDVDELIELARDITARGPAS